VFDGPVRLIGYHICEEAGKRASLRDADCSEIIACVHLAQDLIRPWEARLGIYFPQKAKTLAAEHLTSCESKGG